MNRAGLAALVLAAATLSTCVPAAGDEKHRGVSWEAQPRVVGAAEIEALVRHHVGWIVQTPFGWQTSASDPEVRLKTDGGVFWGETDEGLETTTRLARRHGVKTLLKPHVWIRGGQWRGDLRMQSEEDWRAWFASYETFILHYARFAERVGIEALAIGTELHQAARDRPDDWRRLIRRVREVYRGQLTYSANWHREFQDVTFWDELDYIGIQAYFPLTEKERPSTAELIEGWKRHLPAIEAVQRKYRRPVLFTEVGYKSSTDAAIEPWVWPERDGDLVPDPTTQANAYEAFFDTFWERPWFAGAYFWKWHPWPRWTSRAEHAGFTPQGKPALEVMTRWYGREEAR